MKLAAALIAAWLLAALAGEGRADPIAACTMNASTVAFGDFVGQEKQSTGTITITCTGNGPNQPMAIALSTGSSGAFANRTMQNGASTLSYNLYIDAAHTEIWGNGQGATHQDNVQISFASAGAQSTITATVFGDLPSQPLPAPGAYIDNIVATLTF